MPNARDVSKALGGRWYGQYGTAPCPICQPQGRMNQNALTLADGRDSRLLMHCKKSGCEFSNILAAAGIADGDYSPPDPATVAQRERDKRAQSKKRARQAKQCWQQAGPIEGTLGEQYLFGRGITCNLPATLRYHPSCWHASAQRFPAIVALIEGAQSFAVHRTYLRPDGTGKATIDPAKAMLGGAAGGAVCLTKTQGPLVIAEGIETALSLASGLLSQPSTVWAALSTSGVRALRLPPSPAQLTIAIDSDDGGAGYAAGRDLAERAHALGWAVSLLPAPEGRDWNDALMMKGEDV